MTMKYVLYIIFILQLINTNPSIYAQNDWFWQYPKPQGNTLKDIFVFDSTTAVAVGELGTIMKTTNGGESWIVQHHAGETSYDLYSVHFTDEMIGWAAGGIWDMNKNVLLKTIDGGQNWTEVKTQTDLPFNSVYFVDNDTGFVAGEDGILLRTTDGGNSWDIKKIDDYIGYGWLDVFMLLEITFTDKQTGWIIGDGYYGNQIYKTTDCGKTWLWDEHIIESKVYELNDICFINKDIGFIVGWAGDFLKTTDGGKSWKSENLSVKYQNEDYTGFYSIFFTDSLNGWIAGGDYYATIFRTTDGGENWIEQANNNKEMIHHFYKIRFADKNKGWIIGQFGMIYKTTDEGNNWIPQRENKYGFTSIHFTDKNTGWVVGEKGIILYTEDGGQNWIKQSQNDSLLFSSVYAIDDKNVFVVGSIIKGLSVFDRTGIIFNTTNGGQNWIRHSFDSLYGFNSVTFVNDSVGWITGSELLKTENKGNTFNKISSDANIPRKDIQFANENNGWGSSNNGSSLLKTTNGGINWEQQLIDSNFSVKSFFFINNSIGWVVGYHQVNYYQTDKSVFKTTNGGNNWFSSGVTPISYYSSIHFINENTGWAAGGYQIREHLYSSLIKTTDGGNSWIKQESPQSSELTKVFFINENTGWAVGNGIIKTNNGGGIVSVKNNKELDKTIPSEINLYQNYPNPFNPSTVISYQIPVGTRSRLVGMFVHLKVYDILGREIVTLVNEEKKPGSYSVEFNGTNLSSGIYFYRLTTEKSIITKKMLLLR